MRDDAGGGEVLRVGMGKADCVIDMIDRMQKLGGILRSWQWSESQTIFHVP